MPACLGSYYVEKTTATTTTMTMTEDMLIMSALSTGFVSSAHSTVPPSRSFFFSLKRFRVIWEELVVVKRENFGYHHPLSTPTLLPHPLFSVVVPWGVQTAFVHCVFLFKHYYLFDPTIQPFFENLLRQIIIILHREYIYGETFPFSVIRFHLRMEFPESVYIIFTFKKW